jgi:hypothetical protein
VIGLSSSKIHCSQLCIRLFHTEMLRELFKAKLRSGSYLLPHDARKSRVNSEAAEDTLASSTCKTLSRLRRTWAVSRLVFSQAANSNVDTESSYSLHDCNAREVRLLWSTNPFPAQLRLSRVGMRLVFDFRPHNTSNTKQSRTHPHAMSGRV